MNEANINEKDLLTDFVSEDVFDEKEKFFSRMKKEVYVKFGLTLLYAILLIGSLIIIK